MSYTGVYSSLVAQDAERAPRILDMDRWEELQEIHEWSHIFGDQAEVGTHEEGDYPKTTYTTLSGFKTWDEIYDYNLGRIAYNYSRDDWFTFWGLVGEVCEPFYFYHSGHDNHWPKVGYSTVHDIKDGDSLGEILKVTVDGDDVTVEKGVVRFDGFAGGEDRRSESRGVRE